jgi:hypothetical protein
MPSGNTISDGKKRQMDVPSGKSFQMATADGKKSCVRSAFFFKLQKKVPSVDQMSTPKKPDGACEKCPNQSFFKRVKDETNK